MRVRPVYELTPEVLEEIESTFQSKETTMTTRDDAEQEVEAEEKKEKTKKRFKSRGTRRTE